MNINQAGIDLIKVFEGCKLTAYKDQGGVLTIGFGHTGDDVTEGLTITQEQADELLKKDLESFSRGVNFYLDVPVNANQFSAMVSFAYNLGVKNLAKSSLLHYVELGEFQKAADEFPKWDRVNGVSNSGILRRRLAEQSLFLKLP